MRLTDATLLRAARTGLLAVLGSSATTWPATER
jgi:hypothetical protein